MLYPDVEFTVWSERYGIQPATRNCPACDKSFTTDIPIAIKGYRGLQSKEHGCGKEFVNSVLIPVERDEINFWISFKYGT